MRDGHKHARKVKGLRYDSMRLQDAYRMFIGHDSFRHERSVLINDNHRAEWSFLWRKAQKEAHWAQLKAHADAELSAVQTVNFVFLESGGSSSVAAAEVSGGFIPRGPLPQEIDSEQA
ncbi:hypothetical protein CRG98_004757 [Punica granatum]|uniref:Uncharacterized protein n=1 Tax=Punica granatum TaxID=22663 RepID=A0A2I0L2S9_PUNGR|nr:hypothetical protein CRG98_004757 [Punica granatum]